MLIGLFLMSKTWSSVCNPDESEQVWSDYGGIDGFYIDVILILFRLCLL